MEYGGNNILCFTLHSFKGQTQIEFLWLMFQCHATLLTPAIPTHSACLSHLEGSISANAMRDMKAMVMNVQKLVSFPFLNIAYEITVSVYCLFGFLNQLTDFHDIVMYWNDYRWSLDLLKSYNL
jgi:hypothetical protein